MVLTLSNHHGPRLLKAGRGVDRQMLDPSGMREKDPTPVKCPKQTKKYVTEFDKINKINLKCVRFDLKGTSKKHGWSPKLNNRYINIHGANAGCFYERLMSLFAPSRRVLGAKERLCDLASELCRRGPPLRTYVPRHPAILRDLSRVYQSGFGRRVRIDCRGVGDEVPSEGPSVMARVAWMKSVQREKTRRSPWRVHQSTACERRGRCEYDCCPGWVYSVAKERRAYQTNMVCEECSEFLGRDVFLCNGTKGKVEGETNLWHVCNCHKKFHEQIFDIE